MKITKTFHEHLSNKSGVSKTLKRITALVALLLICSCNNGPQPIEYGQDGCHFCKMTIVDKLHAAEIVTQKGKIYKFDASECMVRFLEEFDRTTIKLYLANNYAKPEALIDATQATFLISENIPSPMGAYLSAFNTKEDAMQIQAKKSGTLYTWEALLTHFKQ